QENCNRSQRSIMIRILAVLLLLSTPAFAQDWSTPARGSKDRADMMDAIRPHVEFLLGAPVEFVIDELRVAGKYGFARVNPQRPGGKQINLAQTPFGERAGYENAELDGTHVEAILVKEGSTWVAVQWQIGATDVWWSWQPYCEDYYPVLADACEGQ
ncbi:MAG: hypothetical protein ABI459_04200, partial [Deltaproteobacteria bacterium]